MAGSSRWCPTSGSKTFWRSEETSVPELPDIELYLGALRSRVEGEILERVRLANPFLLRSVEPPLARVEGSRVVELRRLGKRIVIGLENDLFLVLHLMIAGRLQWKAKGAKPPGRRGLGASTSRAAR